ncbi:MAG: pyridoxamine 5'-phosphate oxidase family protein [Burkholderiales bacterium]|jgi:nitroimidazol reductase NimA-like FMN-containing flavoprotein (pyridoxamine 5'-phosphate oxidase superfamily)
MNDDLQSSRTELNRYPSRGHHDFETVAAILDEAYICHAGFSANGQPFVLPMVYGRDEDMLYLHGSAAGRALRALASGEPLCITVTLVDGLVLARSGFHSSINYRSVVVLGNAEPVAARERERALKVISDHIIPGRWETLRPVNAAELDQTTVLRMQIVEASAKIRSGPPADDEEDYALPIWAGTLDFQPAKPVVTPDARLSQEVVVPTHVSNWHRPKRG